MNRENTFHAYAVGNAADGEGLGNSGAVLCNDGSLENLNSLSVALFDVDVNLNGVSDNNLGGPPRS